MGRPIGTKFKRLLNSTTRDSLGMALARVTLAAGLTATGVSKVLGVSSTTVYHWFRGHGVREKYRSDIELFINIIRRDTTTGVLPALGPYATTRYLDSISLDKRSLSKTTTKLEIPLPPTKAKKQKKQSSDSQRRRTAISTVKDNGLALEDLPMTMRADKEIVLAAVRNNGSALEYAAKNLRDNKEVVMAAIENNPQAIWLASESLQRDKSLYLSAILGDSEILEWSLSSADKDVVMAVVQQNGLALQNADDKLRDDRAVVLLAVDNNGLALKYASSRLKRCRVVASVAVMNDEDASAFVSRHLRQDPVVKAALAAKGQRTQKEDFAPLEGVDGLELQDVLSSLDFGSTDGSVS